MNRTVRQFISPIELFRFSVVDAPAEKKIQMQKIGVIYFLYLLLYAGLEFTLPFLTHLRFNFNSIQQGKIYLFTGLLMLPIQSCVVRRTPMIRQKCVVKIGIMCIIPAFMVVAQATNQFTLYLGLFLYAIVFWLSGPTWCYMIGGTLLTIPLILLIRLENPVHDLKKTS
ncbi:hypothetical protein DICVIV_12844 [Dictyocaulus viviparus]|uniref:Major facilitator superfamily associated domain-containing protein n=1 Tax=Dictyocaulus viviparus TaxID=29172 RepID=A0A0D8X9D3_DICVI|nr:hypothetical protein DICVIV_12844 [Dictyocaulus viviparus]